MPILGAPTLSQIDLPHKGAQVLREEHNAVQADLVAIRAALVAITAQLDLDAGVTDTDYAATNDPAVLTSVTIAA